MDFGESVVDVRVITLSYCTEIQSFIVLDFLLKSASITIIMLIELNQSLSMQKLLAYLSTVKHK